MHERAVGHDRELVAFADDIGFAQRHRVMPLRHLALRVRCPGYGGLVRVAVERAVVDAFRLEEDDRVVRLDRADQEALGVIRIRRHHGHDAADVGEYGLGALRVRLAAADAAAARRAHRDRREEFAAGTVAEARELADDLVETGIDVVGELDFRNRPQAVDAHADRRADDAAFGNRRVDYAVIAVLALQPVGAAKHAAEVADVFAQHDDGRVLVHHDVERRADGLDHVHLGHYFDPPPLTPSTFIMRWRCDSRWRGTSA